jgi:hypothetical protein
MDTLPVEFVTTYDKQGNMLIKDTERISLFDEADTAEDEEVAMALQLLPDGPRKSGLERKSSGPDAGTDDSGYQGNSIYYYAMVMTIEQRQFVCLPMLLSLICVAGQVLILNGILFKNFIASVPNITSWSDLAKLNAMDEEKIGFVVGLVISPLILLAKLMANGEFYDIAIFSAQLKTYQSTPARLKPRSCALAAGRPGVCVDRAL